MTRRFSNDQSDVTRTNAVQQAKSYPLRLVKNDVLPDEMKDGETGMAVPLP